MYGLNAVALVFFGCINVLAYRLCKYPERTHRKVLRTLCAVLLSGNLFRYGIVLLSIRGFFRRNRKQYRKFASSKQNVLPREVL